MQKGGAVQRELPACRQTALPNVGREAHSYLSFLQTVHAASASAAEAARLLPPLVVFAQADPFDHNPAFLDELSLLAAHVSAGRRPPRWVPLGLWSGGERIVYCDASGAPHQPLLLPIGRVWRALFGEKRALPTWIGFTPGACFAVCREALLCGLTPSRVEAALSPSCGLGGIEADLSSICA
mmetsp:Transcript_49598/g.155727  ORF Transcript_49598/g.155727 Transcript_49598/m.155727 type:complete len:182 (+) Transcript_49598:292-837(+)